MNLGQTIDLYAGAPGSGCNPEAAAANGNKCGAPIKNKISADQKAEIKKLHEGGMTQKDIASKLGIHKSTVWTVVSGYKGPVKNKSYTAKWTDTTSNTDAKPVEQHIAPFGNNKFQLNPVEEGNPAAGFKVDIPPVTQQEVGAINYNIKIAKGLGVPQSIVDKLSITQLEKINELANEGWDFLKVGVDGSPIFHEEGNSGNTIKISQETWTQWIDGSPKGTGLNSVKGFINQDATFTAPVKTQEDLPTLKSVVHEWKGNGQSTVRQQTLDYVNNKTANVGPMGKVMLNAIADAPVTKYPLYRTMYLDDKHFTDWKDSYSKEDKIRLAPLGFSTNYEHITNKFSGNTHLFMSPGAKALHIAPITPSFSDEDEHVAAGEFKVTAVHKNIITGKNEIYLAPVGAFEKV